jgi:hypothetical protein
MTELFNTDGMYQTLQKMLQILKKKFSVSGVRN